MYADFRILHLPTDRGTGDVKAVHQDRPAMSCLQEQERKSLIPRLPCLAAGRHILFCALRCPEVDTEANLHTTESGLRTTPACVEDFPTTHRHARQTTGAFGIALSLASEGLYVRCVLCSVPHVGGGSSSGGEATEEKEGCDAVVWVEGRGLKVNLGSWTAGETAARSMVR